MNTDNYYENFSSEKLLIEDERLRMIYSSFPAHNEFTVKKGTIILQQGSVCKDMFFIKKGLVRQYYFKPDGKEVILNFHVEHTGFMCIESIANDKPSFTSYQALEDSVIQLVKKEDFDLALKNYKSVEEMFRVSLISSLASVKERLFSIQFESAQERYTKLLEDFPKITNRVSSRHIASYIGVTPETLSRIKSKKEGSGYEDKNIILKAV